MIISIILFVLLFITTIIVKLMQKNDTVYFEDFLFYQNQTAPE